MHSPKYNVTITCPSCKSNTISSTEIDKDLEPGIHFKKCYRCSITILERVVDRTEYIIKTLLSGFFHQFLPATLARRLFGITLRTFWYTILIHYIYLLTRI